MKRRSRRPAIGRYPLSIEANVTPERLKRFFTKHKDGYGIGDQIRKLCIFARQDLTQDPPFFNLDLITCFNVLIYLGPETQERAIKLLHYALRSTGVLILGKSEAISRYQDMFNLVDRKLRIYSKQPLSNRPDYTMIVDKAGRRDPPPTTMGGSTPPKFDLDREAERAILSRYNPPGFIVDDKLHILKLRGRTRPYLDPSPGDPSLNLLKMIRPELANEVRVAVQKARKENSVVRRSAISIRLNGQTKDVELQVLPLRGPRPDESFFLVLFEERKPPSKALLMMQVQRGPAGAMKRGSASEHHAFLQMKRGLSVTKRQLRTITEEAEATNEELQSVNEELESRNEELQSANEELETAKEELQSTNEELTTLNETLRNRNDELGHINAELERSRAYSEAIVGTVRYPLLVLDSALRVQKANRAFYATFHATAEETLGRALHELGNGQWDIPGLRAKLEKILSFGGQFKDFEARLHFETTGYRDLLIDARRMEGSREEGALLLMSPVDVTDIKHVEEVLKQKSDLARSNQDLGQFAHAASHDLREPLRMVISFMQLISEKYKGKLDNEADEWIGYAVDGAERMQKLIEDLLTYAEVGQGEKVLTPLDCQDILDRVRANLDLQIRETSAVIECNELPPLLVDRTEMVQLFQNLIANAIKFRGEAPPHIRISARQEGGIWVLCVADNGIGIEEAHRERIFAMFQRLHDRSRYPGTGIGLAVCRKIVSRLGGKIWVDSKVGSGSVFYFTLPATAEVAPILEEES